MREANIHCSHLVNRTSGICFDRLGDDEVGAYHSDLAIPRDGTVAVGTSDLAIPSDNTIPIAATDLAILRDGTIAIGATDLAISRELASDILVDSLVNRLKVDETHLLVLYRCWGDSEGSNG